MGCPPVEAATTAAEPVRVAVRVRPLVSKEKLDHARSCLRVHPDVNQIVIGKDRAFSFDYVYHQGSTQQEVYDEACAPLVERCFEGYNATVFAYGQVARARTVAHRLPTESATPHAAPPTNTQQPTADRLGQDVHHGRRQWQHCRL